MPYTLAFFAAAKALVESLLNTSASSPNATDVCAAATEERPIAMAPVLDLPLPYVSSNTFLASSYAALPAVLAVWAVLKAVCAVFALVMPFCNRFARLTK